MRICIAGGPQTGKTTSAKKHAFPNTIHGDDFLSRGWSESSEHLAGLMIASGPWVMEGVQVPRALRKALAARPTVKPCDRLVILRERVGKAAVLKGQEAMAKGVHTVLREILPALRALGVEIL